MLEGTPFVDLRTATVDNRNTTVSCEPNPCPVSCEPVFDMVHVSYLIRGGTRVMWALKNTFNDPLPWLFQLQVSRVANQNADDWENVGLPVENTCYAIDPDQQNFAQGVNDTFYRIRLSTTNATYYSDPVGKQGILSVRDWRLAREVIRQERVRNRLAASDGYLLKRRVTGQDCPRCLDLQTNEVTDPYCPQCYGTGKACGYYYPMACVWADTQPISRGLNLDDQNVRGPVRDITQSARMLMLPLIDEWDVWINRKTDDRYFIHQIDNIAEWRGVPLIASVKMRPLAYTHVVYTIAIPQQDAWLQQTC